MLNNALIVNFYYLKIIHILHQYYHPKVTGRILKNKQKNIGVCIHEIIRLIFTEMKMKMKNRSHRCDIIRRRSSYGHKYSTYYKNCLIMMMFIYIKQHLSNIWNKVLKIGLSNF